LAQVSAPRKLQEALANEEANKKMKVAMYFMMSRMVYKGT